MAVIIDDFEVVVETPEAVPATDTPADQAEASAPRLAPQDIAEIERRRLERLDRIWAH